MNATNEYTAANSSTTDSGASQAGMHPLSRPAAGRMLGGVAAGIGRSLGIDPLIVRVAFVVLALIGGAGVPLYLAGWLLIPDEQSGESVASDLIRSFSAGR